MKTKRRPRPVHKVTVKLPDLELTQKQLNALKKAFKNVVVESLGPVTRPLCFFFVPLKRPAMAKARKAAKKTKTT